MYLTRANYSDLRKNYKPTRNQVIIDEFANSGDECAKVEGWTHKKADYCANALNDTIKRCRHRDTIKAVLRSGEVYLIKL